MRFVLVDGATAIGNDPQYGGPTPPDVLARIATALDVQLNRDVSPYWGGNYWVRAGTSSDVQPGEVVCALLDALPNAPGAVAYHDVDGNEVPVVYLARTACTSLMTGPGSVSAALSHELCETAGDPFVNAWRDDGRGYEWAQELCDAVQEAGYEIAGVAVSDFVLPSFFAPGSEGPFDYLGTVGLGAVSAPLQTMNGGYQLRRQAGTEETQVDGHIAAQRLEKKRHWSSRTARRGARV